MTLKAVLFDLDDTLVQIDPDGFTRRFLDQLAAYVTDRLPTIKPDQFKKAIVDATRAVTRNLDPAKPNSQVISSVLTTTLGLTSAEMAPITSEYFASSYQELRAMASPVLGALELINYLAGSGLRLAIATNPLFVVTATYARVRWAGLDPAAPFALVTTADNMHFTKPHPHFYEEVLAQLGVEAEDALMVGDNFDNDIRPALAIGMSAYGVTPHRADGGQKIDIPADVEASRLAQGSLAELQERLAEGWPGAMPSPPVTVEQAVKRLPARILGNVAALYGLTAGLSGTLRTELAVIVRSECPTKSTIAPSNAAEAASTSTRTSVRPGARATKRRAKPITPSPRRRCCWPRSPAAASGSGRPPPSPRRRSL